MNPADLYTDIIKEYSASPHNKGSLTSPSLVIPGRNPTCGDEIELEISEKDHRILDASYTGTGCAISQASVSIMIDLIRGKTLTEAAELTRLFLAMSRREPLEDADLERLEEAAALQNAANLPARVKCATMPWHTLERALEQLKS